MQEPLVEPSIEPLTEPLVARRTHLHDVVLLAVQPAEREEGHFELRTAADDGGGHVLHLDRAVGIEPLEIGEGGARASYLLLPLELDGDQVGVVVRLGVRDGLTRKARAVNEDVNRAVNRAVRRTAWCARWR